MREGLDIGYCSREWVFVTTESWAGQPAAQVEWPSLDRTFVFLQVLMSGGSLPAFGIFFPLTYNTQRCIESTFNRGFEFKICLERRVDPAAQWLDRLEHILVHWFMIVIKACTKISTSPNQIATQLGRGWILHWFYPSFVNKHDEKCICIIIYSTIWTLETLSDTVVFSIQRGWNASKLNKIPIAQKQVQNFLFEWMFVFLIHCKLRYLGVGRKAWCARNSTKRLNYSPKRILDIFVFCAHGPAWARAGVPGRGGTRSLRSASAHSLSRFS